VVAALQAETIHPVIELATLKTHLTKPDTDLVLVDVRDTQSYQVSHLPGALNLPAEQTFNQHGDHTRIASLQQVREVLSNLGIKNSDYLVLYDDGLLKDAAHVFWVLETYGHKKISVLDGGIAAWRQQQGKLTTIVTPRPKSEYLPSIATHRLSTELTTLLGIRNANVAIIDARDYQEYLGLRSHAKRKGHIPNAISIPWSENLTKAKTLPELKSREALQSLYRALDKKESVITYCNRGKESAVTYLVLRNLGYNVSVYDGAWLEWGNDDQLPIETGSQLRGHTPDAH
jgi:thiosulfate/3-mercaptopyruvate sulfurtransferase